MPLSLRGLLAAALACGLVAGLVFFAVQAVTTRPLIAQAEISEPATHGAGPQEWQPAEGVERAAYTLAAAVLIGIGYAFLLVGAIAVSGRGVKVGSGLVWGAAGFVAFFAAPALGLPPEPPGAQAADLLPRQAWWLATSLATCAGLALLVLQNRTPLRLLGALLLLAPHVVGAPHRASGAEPGADLLSGFVWAAFAANAALWLTLGLAVGALLPRLEPGARLTVRPSLR